MGGRESLTTRGGGDKWKKNKQQLNDSQRQGRRERLSKRGEGTGNNSLTQGEQPKGIHLGSQGQTQKNPRVSHKTKTKERGRRF